MKPVHARFVSLKNISEKTFYQEKENNTKIKWRVSLILILVRGRRESESENHRSLASSKCLEKSPTRSSPIGGKRKGEEIDDDYKIEAVRAKLMFDLQAVADKMKVAMFKNREDEDYVRP